MRRMAGFTLIELIMVIVILGIIALMSTQFVTQVVGGYRSAAERQKLAAAGSVALEKMSRELRQAVPNSIRTLRDSSMNCVEFRPIEAITDYLDDSVTVSVSTLQAVGIGRAATGRVAVYPTSSGDLYAPANPGSMTTESATLPAGTGVVTLTLAAGHRFRADSPTRRLYVVGEPVAYCHLAGTDRLTRHAGYTPSGLVEGLPGALAGVPSAIVATRLDPSEPRRAQFSYSEPTLTRNGVVVMTLALLDVQSRELLSLTQEVQIRNVP